MAEIPATSQPDPSIVATTVKVADKEHVSDEVRLKEQLDQDARRKVRKLRYMKFTSSEDILSRFPYPSELEEEDGVFTWNGYVILTQPDVPGILEAEFDTLPPATGRIKFKSHLDQRYCGISAPQITEFLKRNEHHSVWTMRKRSQRTKTSVSSGPFKVLQMDLTDIPKRGVYRYLMVVVDTWSKYVWAVPLAKKSGEIVTRELGKIFETFPEGVRVGAIRSDNGPEFKNPQMTALLAKTNTKQVFGLPHNPAGQGQNERSNANLKMYLFSETEGDGSVKAFLPALKRSVKALNGSVCHSTGFVPAMILNTKDKQVIKAVNERLQKNSEQTQPNARYLPPLKKGDKVRLLIEELDNDVKRQIKAGSYKASHAPPWSEKLYTVVYQDKNNFVRVAEIKKDLFTRGGCLLVPTPDDGQDEDDGQDDSMDTSQ